MTAASAFPPAFPLAPNVNVTATRRALIDNLYCELLVLADDARAGVAEAQVPKDALLRIRTATESLRLTSFVLQMLQWLVELRADPAADAAAASPPPSPPDWQPDDLTDLPEGLQGQIDVALRLADRAGRLAPDTGAAALQPVPHMLFGQLKTHFG